MGSCDPPLAYLVEFVLLLASDAKVHNQLKLLEDLLPIDLWEALQLHKTPERLPQPSEKLLPSMQN